MAKLLSILALAAAAQAASLKDVKHVVLLMMENRSFQHVSDGYYDSCLSQALILA